MNIGGETKPLAVFDLCGTLVRDDTTLALLRWHFRRSGAGGKAWLVDAIAARKHPVRLGFAVAERIGRRAYAKHLLLRMLKGCPVECLEASAEGYAAWALTHRANAQVVALLEQARRSGCRPVIASASLMPVVEAFARQLGVEHVGSSLTVRSAMLTGSYERDIAGRKSGALARKFGEDVLCELELTVSDNFTDLSLMKKSRRALAVAHSRRHAARWASEGVEVLRVTPA